MVVRVVLSEREKRTQALPAWIDGSAESPM